MPLKLVSYESIITGPVEPIDWLVKDLIVNGDRALVYGEPGAMKSWLLLDLALHLAAGMKWLEQFDIPQAKRVLYIDEEMSQRTAKGRIRRLAAGAGFKVQELPFAVLSGAGLQVEEGRIETLIAELTALHFDPDVVIIETLRSVMVGDENSAQEVRRFWRWVEPFRQSNKTLIVSHHMRKPQQGSNNPRYRASGSTDLVAGPDTTIAVERTGRQTTAKLSHMKCRNAQERDPFVVSLQDQGIEEDCPVLFRLENAHAAKGGAQRANEQLANLIVEYLVTLPEGRATTNQIKTHFAEQSISADRIEKALACLRNDPRVIKPCRGVWQWQEVAEQIIDLSAKPPSLIGVAVAAASDEPPTTKTTGPAEAEIAVH